MADPRFYDNRGPFRLAELCALLSIALPANAKSGALVEDVAALEDAGSPHLVYCTGKKTAAVLANSHAGFCLVDSDAELMASASRVVLRSNSAALAFANAARVFYPDAGLQQWAQTKPIHVSAKLEEGVRLSLGVVVGPGAEIGGGTHVGPNTVIGRGVTIGRNCEIGSNTSVTHAHLGDGVTILPGAQIGQPGFGFASGSSGHTKIPQLGRVIVQDRVEIGACATIDRGALGDTVIGEGTKIDNLVQIGHNTHIGRNCMIVAQVGISGSCELGDFVVLGGQAGLADHVRVGDGARFAARSAAAPGEIAGGHDYGGAPARPIQQWRRELAAVAMLSRRPRRTPNG
ncbi:MAG TPA: UDP-3-O-(3-hydroxymyristoyl)glucosamine N-acyltransferase [Rhizomicrobium sp.]|jgi:UDP-3-O-[3-hydroxymyristoyl] glucosamine N-acyltransferase|nr:UDP-3-O-(3-hydroxymyristoyl)glucosamine N-acyltransferase [Rhizomicrobium sp.]